MNGIKLESQNNNLRYKLSVPEGTDMVFVCVVTKGADTMLELRTKIINGTTIVSNVEVSDLCGAPNTLVIDLRHSICETHHITINNVNLTLCKGNLTGVQPELEFLPAGKVTNVTLSRNNIKLVSFNTYTQIETIIKIINGHNQRFLKSIHAMRDDEFRIVDVVEIGYYENLSCAISINVSDGERYALRMDNTIIVIQDGEWTWHSI